MNDMAPAGDGSGETLSAQVELHNLAATCASLLIRPASLTPGKPEPVSGTWYDRRDLDRAFASALAICWNDALPAPDDADELALYLQTAMTKAIAAAEKLEGQPGFVPAANVQQLFRNHILEWVRSEVDLIVAGVETETSWRHPQDTIEETVAELAETGLRLTIRAVADFLTGDPRGRQADELFATDFFAAGAWSAAWPIDAVARLTTFKREANKRNAHVTGSRPLVEDRRVYRPATYRTELTAISDALAAFSRHVDARLLPDWWPAWVLGHAE